ncbi:MAG TPA: hypothetical protein VNO55_08865 [Polyangia bacterium]|nr:hypothetical protein [Polyangia bacterium]
MSAALAVAVYVGRIRQFRRVDWMVYLSWVGLMLGLCLTTSGFVWAGVRAGAPLPPEATAVPLGAVIFTLAIAVDTIGHRTIYKEALRGGEALVHHVIIVAGIASCVLLCAAYSGGAIYAVPALVLTGLSFIYSLVDEVMHWRRYLSAKSDVVEMWSHVFILIGHGVMMTGWWLWYARGYAGVTETLRALAHRLAGGGP